jgi:uncharacterized protein (TIGR02246 family)
MRATFIAVFAIVVLHGGALISDAAQGRQAAASEVNARLQKLEDREAIRSLFIDYGRTLDARDFTAFAQLFAKDAEFVGGAGATATGRDAVGALLQRLITTNYPDSRGNNFHLFFGETIEVNGNEATAVSKGAFVMASGTNRPEMLLLATYRDQFVREDGRWKFKRREIHGDIPVPRVPSQ